MDIDLFFARADVRELLSPSQITALKGLMRDSEKEVPSEADTPDETDHAGRFKIWTDGSCLGNPGPGGWACVGENGVEYSDGVPDTTNNRMEIQAVIAALNRFPNKKQMTIITDSKLVVNTMTQGWKTKANIDLWDVLFLELEGRDVEWEWVKGHADDKGNQRADILALTAAGKAKAAL